MKVSSSFRDPSGFLFSSGGRLLRQVNRCYRPNYERLIQSGLYRRLVDEKLMIAHEECDYEPLLPALAYRILKPELIPFVSYPYEWCFSQLQDAARLTLKIERIALEHGMTLKDASAYNVQFAEGQPIFIDTLSFEEHQEGQPWKAYRQFCRHFLAPLALMSLRDVRSSKLLAAFIDGIPLDLCSRLLPLRSRLRYTLLVHIHAHAYSEKRWGGPAPAHARIAYPARDCSESSAVSSRRSSV